MGLAAEAVEVHSVGRRSSGELWVAQSDDCAGGAQRHKVPQLFAAVRAENRSHPLRDRTPTKSVSGRAPVGAYLHRTGFEPAKLTAAELKSAPFQATMVNMFNDTRSCEAGVSST